MNFGRRDVNIANAIYGYSKGVVMLRFKHPRKGVKMDRTTEDVAAPLPPKIMKYYKNVHLDIDILFVIRHHSYWQYQGTLDLSIVDLCLAMILNEYRMQ